MNNMIFQNTIVIILGIVELSVFIVGMYVWITEKPNKIYNRKYEFLKQKEKSDTV